jgi:hypothetical protein
MRDKGKPGRDVKCQSTLVDIIDRVPNIFNANEGWVVNNMRLEYANKIVVILPIIYQKDRWNVLTITLL